MISGQSFTLLANIALTDALCVAASGRYAYAQGDSGLIVIELSDTPSVVGILYVPSPSFALATNGKYVYALSKGTSQMSIVDVSIPSNPTLCGTWTTGGGPQGIALVGNLVLIACGDDGTLQVWNVADPFAAALVGTVSVAASGSYDPYAVAALGTLACTINPDSDNVMKVIDISTPTLPAVIASVALPSACTDIVMGGNRAYVADQQGLLRIFDLTTPTAPVELPPGVVVGGSSWGVAIAGQAFLVDRFGNTLQALDVGVSPPLVVGKIATFNSPLRVAVSGSYVSVACMGDGFVQIFGIGRSEKPSFNFPVSFPRAGFDPAGNPEGR